VVQFPSESGALINGWLIEGQKGAGVIALMHGVRASRVDMLGRARFLKDAGYTVLLFDFQAHGESRGEHITFGYLESRDASAALEFLRANFPDEKIGLIGVSMGGAAALLATPPLEVDAMVLEMVYPTISQAVSDRLVMNLGGWSGALTPLLTWQLKPRLGFGPEALRPIDNVGSISAPKLFIAGTEDRHTTIEESRQLFNAAREPKEFWAIEGAAHVNFHEFARRDYESRVLDFFDKYLRH
jgi:alpha-beta hydrolase superfamily lysophospholipase